MFKETCPNCHKDFPITRRGQKFCTTKCKNEFHQKKNKGYDVKTKISPLKIIASSGNEDLLRGFIAPTPIPSSAYDSEPVDLKGTDEYPQMQQPDNSGLTRQQLEIRKKKLGF